jgi:hypothetical protein
MSRDREIKKLKKEIETLKNGSYGI